MSSKVNKFNELFGTVFEKLGRHGKTHSIITGDFNVDLIRGRPKKVKLRVPLYRPQEHRDLLGT